MSQQAEQVIIGVDPAEKTLRRTGRHQKGAAMTYVEAVALTCW